MALFLSLPSFGAGNGNGGCNGNTAQNGKVCPPPTTPPTYGYTKTTVNGVTTFSSFSPAFVFTPENIQAFAYQAIKDTYPVNDTGAYQNRLLTPYALNGANAYSLFAPGYRYFYTINVSGGNVTSIVFSRMNAKNLIFFNASN